MLISEYLLFILGRRHLEKKRHFEFCLHPTFNLGAILIVARWLEDLRALPRDRLCG